MVFEHRQSRGLTKGEVAALPDKKKIENPERPMRIDARYTTGSWRRHVCCQGRRVGDSFGLPIVSLFRSGDLDNLFASYTKEIGGKARPYWGMGRSYSTLGERARLNVNGPR